MNTGGQNRGITRHGYDATSSLSHAAQRALYPDLKLTAPRLPNRAATIPVTLLYISKQPKQPLSDVANGPFTSEHLFQYPIRLCHQDRV